MERISGGEMGQDVHTRIFLYAMTPSLSGAGPAPLDHSLPSSQPRFFPNSWRAEPGDVWVPRLGDN